jgi:hypothetical protein
MARLITTSLKREGYINELIPVLPALAALDRSH